MLHATNSPKLSWLKCDVGFYFLHFRFLTGGGEGHVQKRSSRAKNRDGVETSCRCRLGQDGTSEPTSKLRRIRSVILIRPTALLTVKQRQEFPPPNIINRKTPRMIRPIMGAPELPLPDFVEFGLVFRLIGRPEFGATRPHRSQTPLVSQLPPLLRQT